LGVQVIRHRNGEKQQNQRHADGGPFQERMPGSSLPLVDPARAPDAEDASRGQHPNDIEEKFHRLLPDPYFDNLPLTPTRNKSLGSHALHQQLMQEGSVA